MPTDTVSLVTGANRGIGTEVVRQLAELGHAVYLGSRDLAAGQATAAPMVAAGLDVTAVELDVTDAATVDATARAIDDRHQRLDVLVNNAAIHYDTWQSAIGADLTTVHEALETNVFGAWRALQAVLPLLRRGRHARVVNVSSGDGSITEITGGGRPAYRLSKLSLNALTRIWAAELRAVGVLVNSVCPGWVATDMGGPGGRPVSDGAAGVVWAATLPDSGPTGGFFRDRRPIPW